MCGGLIIGRQFRECRLFAAFRLLAACCAVLAALRAVLTAFRLLAADRTVLAAVRFLATFGFLGATSGLLLAAIRCVSFGANTPDNKQHCDEN